MDFSPIALAINAALTIHTLMYFVYERFCFQLVPTKFNCIELKCSCKKHNKIIMVKVQSIIQSHAYTLLYWIVYAVGTRHNTADFELVPSNCFMPYLCRLLGQPPRAHNQDDTVISKNHLNFVLLGKRIGG